MELVHNNEHYYPECHVFSDEEYDYAIVNGESITRYYGPNGGDYESIPLHTLADIKWVLATSPWIMEVLAKDRCKLYKHHQELIDRLASQDRHIQLLQTILECKQGILCQP